MQVLVYSMCENREMSTLSFYYYVYSVVVMFWLKTLNSCNAKLIFAAQMMQDLDKCTWVKYIKKYCAAIVSGMSGQSIKKISLIFTKANAYMYFNDIEITNKCNMYRETTLFTIVKIYRLQHKA